MIVNFLVDKTYFVKSVLDSITSSLMIIMKYVVYSPFEGIKMVIINKDVMNIVVGYPSSNPERGCLHFT